MDRTQEFLQCVRSSGGSTAGKLGHHYEVPKTKGAFHDAAADIARGVHRTSSVLNKLTKLVRRQGLFDDPTEEINNLIFRIKQDLDELNTKCDSAQQYVDGKKRSLGEQNQATSHNGKVVSQLKTDLMHATKDFKTVLEMRSSKMKESQQRKVELTGNATVSPMRQFNASSAQSTKKMGGGGNGNGGPQSPTQKMGQPMPMQSPYSDMVAVGHQDFMEGGRGNGMDLMSGNGDYMQQQLLLAPPAAAMYYESREKAVTEVEKTIGELGTLFKRLATMISEQQELVERIDDDVEQAVSHADNAHKLLLQTYEKVSSNKALYTKIFAILAIFILFFVLFLM